MINKEQAEEVNGAPSSNHYKQLEIEPIEIMRKNGYAKEYLQESALKYLMRYEHKNGIEDLRKLIWCAEQLMEIEEYQ